MLVEDNVHERDNLDVIAYLSPEPDGEDPGSLGVGLYRLIQLFGTPQVPGYRAGEDISWRTDETFKYLFRARRADTEEGDDLPAEWLFTVHDSHVRYGASVAEWRDEDGEFTADDQVALTSYALVQQLVVEPLEAVYEDILYWTMDDRRPRISGVVLTETTRTLLLFSLAMELGLASVLLFFYSPGNEPTQLQLSLLLLSTVVVFYLTIRSTLV